MNETRQCTATHRDESGTLFRCVKSARHDYEGPDFSPGHYFAPTNPAVPAPPAEGGEDDVIQKARDEISRLCAGRGRMTGNGLAGRRWTMCIPPSDDDSDAIFDALARHAAALSQRVRELEEALRIIAGDYSGHDLSDYLRNHNDSASNYASSADQLRAVARHARSA